MPEMLRNSGALVPRYEQFESISLQQRVADKLCRELTRWRAHYRPPYSGAFGARRGVCMSLLCLGARAERGAPSYSPGIHYWRKRGSKPSSRSDLKTTEHLMCRALIRRSVISASVNPLTANFAAE